MLVITDLFGNTEALTDIKNAEIIEEVNGDFSLSFTCFLSERNEHSFHLIQEESIVDLDGHEFRIKRLKENRNRKDVFAQHIFFETIDNQVYGTNGGTHSLDSAANFALSDSSWTFENTDVTDSKFLPNFGDSNTVSLIRKICSEFECEVKISPNKHLVFEKEIGEDKDSQFRYKNNIKVLDRTVDTTNLTTVIKGYGADGLEVEYRSPNVGLYGERHAEPVRDERFTNPENLIEKCKKAIQDVPEVSIEVEVSQLGFDANLGDKVWLIYEPLNLEFQTRIMSVRSWPFLNRSPVVELSNRKQTFTDLLTETKIEIDENKKETRSKIEQTNERISFEVERVDESIAALRIEADNISLSVQTLDNRMGTAEAQILIQAGEISQRVSYTDYNGQTIGSLINQTPYAIDIEAGKLNLKGYATFSSLSTAGTTTIDGSNIRTESMSADAIFGGTLKFSYFSSLYEENNGYNTLVFSSGGYKFEPGGTIDFGNNPVVGLNVYASFG